MCKAMYVYIYIYFTRNASSNVHIYSTNFKTWNNSITILSYFVYFYATFYTNIDVHPLRMIHEGTKNVGVLVL